MSGYKIEEDDGTTTYYDSSGNVIEIDETGKALSRSGQGASRSGGSYSRQRERSKLEKTAEAIGFIASLPNPFSETGETIGETAVRKAKDAGKYVVDKTAEKLRNWWNKPKTETKKTEQKLAEKPKGGGAKKTTKKQSQVVSRNNQRKQQTQVVPRSRNIQTKQITELGSVSSQVKRDQIQQAAQRLIEQEKQEDPLYDYERESIRIIEAAQRKRVPWRLPPIDVGMTRMTGFEPFSATADQTFNVFYGSGSIDPFIRS